MNIDSTVIEFVIKEIAAKTIVYGLVGGMGASFLACVFGFFIFRVFPSFFHLS